MTINSVVLTLFSAGCFLPFLIAAPLNLLLGPGPTSTMPSIACPDDVQNRPCCDYTAGININSFFNVQGGLIYSGTAIAQDPVGGLISATTLTAPSVVAAPANFLPNQTYANYMYIGEEDGQTGGAEIDTSHVVLYPAVPDIMETAQFGAFVYFPFANQGQATIELTTQSGVCGTIHANAAVNNFAALKYGFRYARTRNATHAGAGLLPLSLARAAKTRGRK